MPDSRALRSRSQRCTTLWFSSGRRATKELTIRLCSRTAACTTNTLAAGVHSIVASYAGDANNTASANAPLSQVVNEALKKALD